MNKMKKFMSALSLVVMAFVCAFAFAGCGASADEFSKAESATAEEITEYLDERTELGLGNGFDMTLSTTMTMMNIKMTINARIKILFDDDTVSKAVCTMGMSGNGTFKVYAYVKDSKLYTRTTGNMDGQKIDAKYVSDFDGDFGMGGQYDLQSIKDQIQESINQVVSTLTTSPAEVLETMGLKKIVDEENGTARFQIKSDYVDVDEETGKSTKLGTYTFVLGFEGNELVEISASTKMSGMNVSTTIKTLTEISDSEYPSETELAKYVPGTMPLD